MTRRPPSCSIGGVVVLAAAAMLLGACSHKNSEDTTETSAAPAEQQATHGPFFPQCGGVSDETVSELTQVRGLVNTARNSAGCQWLQNGSTLGPHFSFTWYRGSPIGRERKTEELQRTRVDDITIEGHSGFIAVANDPTMGDTLCEVGIQFDDDFIEWSVSFAEAPFPPACDVATELTRQSIANSK